MAQLSLSLLGGLQITLNRQPVSGFVYNKARALLVYLAVEADRPHHRDTLVGLLWPDLPDTAARTNLRQALANLREVIGDAIATPPFLLITRDTIQFNPASDYDLDVAAFTIHLAACERHVHRHLERCRSCAARMEQTIALYRSDFLAEFAPGDSAPFEEWQLLQRERLHQRALDALTHLAGYHERRGDNEQASRYAQRQIELEPWREETHRQLMRLLARSGQRSAALAQYETCRRMLIRDLGVEPDAETTALYEQLRDTASSELRDLSSELPLRMRETQNSEFKTQNLQNFPAQTTPLIGRERELAELGALLENPACRLITVVGPGGIGKTRLALATAAEQAETFTHGAAFVSLAAISAPAFVTPAILGALGVALQGQRKPREQLLDYLRKKELLLVLDNFEHLIDAAPLVGDLVAVAPRLIVLITSRAVLRLSGEHEHVVPALTLPREHHLRDLTALARVPAVDLFVQRSRMVKADFHLNEQNAAAVASLCQRLDGLPLAIELAAARTKLFKPATLLARLDQRLALLINGPRDLPARQQTIRATIDWSYHLLDDAEKILFARLGVFVGGCTMAAIEMVCTIDGDLPFNLIDGAAALVDKSLLRQTEGADGEPRTAMLETIREYALERLDRMAEAQTIRQQHAQYYLALAEAAEPGLWEVRQHEGSPAQLLSEHDNLRAALGWSQGPAGSAEIGLRLVGALGKFWFGYGHLSEGRAWLASALAQPYTAALSQARAKALGWAGWLAQFQGDGGVADAYYDEALALSRAIGDRHGTAMRLHDLGLIAMTRGEYARAAILLQESLALFRALGDRYGSADVLMLLGVTARSQGDYVRAMMLFEESLALWRELGDNVGMADVLDGMGRVKFNQGDYVRAAALYQEALALARQAGHHHLIAMVRSNFGRVIHVQGDHRQGLAQIEESVAWFRDVGHKEGLAWALLQLSAVIYTQGDDVRARGILREALVLQQENNRQGMISESLELFAGLEMRQRQPERAARLFGAADALRETIGAPLSPVERLEYEPNVAAARAELNNMTFAAAWAEGRAMTLEQAIAHALSESDPSAERFRRR